MSQGKPRSPHDTLAILILLASFAVAAGPADVVITTAHDSKGENAVRAELTRLLATYDLGPWLFTRSVVIEERTIPHSHPVLTLNTRHEGSDLRLLSAFIHEEIHWHLDARSEQTQAAVVELMKLYPSAPVGGREGAQDALSTYQHLIVNYLEYQAMKRLVGDNQAKEVFDYWATDKYTWIYRTVLADETRLGEVVTRHGLGI